MREWIWALIVGLAIAVFVVEAWRDTVQYAADDTNSFAASTDDDSQYWFSIANGQAQRTDPFGNLLD